MTLPALLSHFGIESSRFVTTSGRIVFDGVQTEGERGFVHTTYGPVTPVPNHIFHGEMEEPVDSADAEVWWEDGEELGKHISSMAEAFPEFKYISPEPDRAPCWFGTIDTGRGKFSIGVILRRDRGMPFVTVLDEIRLGASAGRRWVRSPHLYDNGNLCIARQTDWNPEVHTVSTATAWAAHWLAAFTEWRISRRWPVEGVQSFAA